VTLQNEPLQQLTDLCVRLETLAAAPPAADLADDIARARAA
jgi:hypothetical protein